MSTEREDLEPEKARGRVNVKCLLVNVDLVIEGTGRPKQRKQSIGQQRNRSLALSRSYFTLQCLCESTTPMHQADQGIGRTTS